MFQVHFDLILSVIPEAATRLDSTSCSSFYLKMTPMVTKPQYATLVLPPDILSSCVHEWHMVCIKMCM